MEIKYPEIEVEIDISGPKGNGYFIIGAVAKALERNGVSAEEVEQYHTESQAGDYDNLLEVAGNWVTFIY